MVLDSLDLTRLTASHARSLRSLIGATHAPQRAATASKAVMLAALQAAEIELLTTFSHVTLAERATLPVCGVWTLHDLIGHLADWDRYFANWLTALRGETPLALYWDEDGDRLNHYLWQQRQGEAWDTTWHDFRTQRADLLTALDQVPEDAFMRQYPAAAAMPYPSIYHCAWSALEHYLDHAAGVRYQLALPLPAALLRFEGPYSG